MFRDLAVDPAPLTAKAEELRRSGQTVMLIAVDGEAAGVLGVSDPIKESTAEAIRELKAAGMKIIMVTGDNATTARAVADKLGIESEADVLPEGKAEVIKAHQAKGAIVAMAGDGVSDLSPWHVDGTGKWRRSSPALLAYHQRAAGRESFSAGYAYGDGIMAPALPHPLPLRGRGVPNGSRAAEGGDRCLSGY